MNQKIISRINMYLQAKGIKKVQLAEKINWGQSKLISQLNGTRGLSIELLAAIFAEYPDLNKDFVFTGEGDLIKKDIPTPSSNEDNDEIKELKIQLREKDAQIKVLKSLINNENAHARASMRKKFGK